MAAAADYSYVFATVGLGKLQDEAVALAAVLDADGAPAQASRVRQAFLRLVSDLERIAQETAADAEKKIKAQEITSRVRPDTQGGGGPRLNDYVGVSHALPGVEGSVGVNHEPTLDQGVPWWITNEIGSSARIGDEIRGFFQPGWRRPNPAEFREHPLFTPRAKGPKGTIENPIPDRRFVRDGGKAAEVLWHTKIRRAKQQFLASCDAALSAAPRRRRGGRGGPLPGRGRP